MNEGSGRLIAQFWQRVDALRQLRDLSDDQLSAECFRTRNAFRNARKGLSVPGVDFVENMARVLDVDVRYLVTGYGSDADPFIPADVPMPIRPQKVLDEALRSARAVQVPNTAINLVLSKKPDPRLGADRILELFFQAASLMSGKRKPSQRVARKKAPPSAK
jgi:transcriptional regulator with XRE-family HTH domain